MLFLSGLDLSGSLVFASDLSYFFFLKKRDRKATLACWNTRHFQRGSTTLDVRLFCAFQLSAGDTPFFFFFSHVKSMTSELYWPDDKFHAKVHPSIHQTILHPIEWYQTCDTEIFIYLPTVRLVQKFWKRLDSCTDWRPAGSFEPQQLISMSIVKWMYST